MSAKKRKKPGVQIGTAMRITRKKPAKKAPYASQARKNEREERKGY